MPNENVIRDKLSKSLSVLEPDLRLVETNHKLPNPVGAKGFIDILARDKYGNYVIIELKRSDQAAREALNEILKYMPLFREQYGIQPHQVRCLIVSTTWRELTAPYSEFRRLCECQTEGIEIAVNNSGKVLTARRVDVHKFDDRSSVFQTHGVYLYQKAEDRNAAVPEICTALDKVGAEGYLVLRMDCSEDHIPYRYAAYVVPTKVATAVATKLTKTVRDHLGEEADDPQAARVYHEELFLELLSKRTVKQPRSRAWTYEAGQPMKFVSLIEQQGWLVRDVERKGPFHSAVVTPDAEIVEMLKGLKGKNPVRFERLVSPRLKLDWAETRKAASNCLGNNTVWTHTFNWFLDRVERTCPDANVHARMFNPQLLPEVLYHVATEADPSYLPVLYVEATSPDAQHREALVGTITWDGKTKPKSVRRAFAGLPDGFQGYYMARVIGGVFDFDPQLMRGHGLAYTAWRIGYTSKGAKVEKELAVSRTGAVSEVKAKKKPKLLFDFMTQNEPYLRELIETTDSYVGRL